MEDALRAHVEAFGEVPLPDGKVYGPTTVEDTTYHTRELYQSMVDEFRTDPGAELADKVANNAFAATKGSIYDAIDEAHEFAGVKRQKKNAFERIVSAPGVVTKKRRFDGARTIPKGDRVQCANAIENATDKHATANQSANLRRQRLCIRGRTSSLSRHAHAKAVWRNVSFVFAPARGSILALRDDRIQRHVAIPSARNDLQLNGDCHDDEEAFLFR